MIRYLCGVLVLASLWFSAPPAGAQAAPAGCRLILGFKALHDLAPLEVGDCVDNQSYAGNGDAQQHTTNGLLVWRKADNFTAFTNGYRTWINGPFGLQVRLNIERFPWEGDAPPAGVIVDLTGHVAHDLPGTAFPLGQTVASTVDRRTNPADVYSITLAAGQTLHFDVRSIGHRYAVTLTPPNIRQLFGAGGVPDGTPRCTQAAVVPPNVSHNCSANIPVVATGTYYLIVSTEESDVRYTLYVKAA